jgi:hypothetical protein
MVQPEGWLSWAHIHIAAWITPDRKMATNVKCCKVICTVGLESVLEGTDSFIAGNVRQKILRPQVALRKEVAHVTTVTSWIIAKTIGTWVGFDVEFGVHGG